MLAKQLSRLFVSLLVMPTFFAVPSLAADPQDDVIAQIGPYTLTAEVFLNQMKMISPKMQASISPNAHFKEELLNNWVDMTLMAVEAKNLNLDKDPLIKAKIENAQHVVLAQEYKKKQVEEKISASKEAITKFYNDHKSEFEDPEMIRASHILIAIKGKDEAAQAEAEKKAREVKDKLAKGGDFAALAKEYSDDTVTGQKGGDLGQFPKGRMVPEFDAAAFAIPKGQTSDLVKTTYGFHIIKVIDKVAPTAKPLEEVQEKIAKRMEAAQREKASKELIETLKKKHQVTINKALFDNLLPPATDKGSEKKNLR